MRFVRLCSLRLLLAGLALSTALVQLPARADEPPSAPTAVQAASAEGVVNLNTAEEAELLRLPGVGPSKARAILELRAKLSGFKRLEDLMRVKGIGRKTFRKLAPMLTLQGPTTLTAKASRRASASQEAERE